MVSAILGNSEVLEQVNFVTQSTRWRILKLLKDARPMYISEIADKINENSDKSTVRNTSFHLSNLAEKGLVRGQLRELEPNNERAGNSGRAAKFYSITKRGKNLIKTLEELQIEI